MLARGCAGRRFVVAYVWRTSAISSCEILYVAPLTNNQHYFVTVFIPHTVINHNKTDHSHSNTNTLTLTLTLILTASNCK